MSDRDPKSFDCVQSMRQVRDKLSAEIEGMSYDGVVRWLRGHRYADPVLERLAASAIQKAEGLDSSSLRQ